MQYKRLTGLLTIVLSSICLYYLTFTFVARRVDQEATEYATENGKVDFEKKQVFLNEKLDKTVFTLLGKKFTYEEVSNRAIKLGLDLEPGMHIILEVDIFHILKEMAGSEGNKMTFNKVIDRSRKIYEKNSNKSALDCFFEAYKDIYPNKRLNTIFFREEHSLDDEAIISKIKKEVKEKIVLTKAVIDKRLNGQGLGGAVVRLSPKEGGIEVEIPGITSIQSIIKIIESTAELGFYSLISKSEDLLEVNDLLKQMERNTIRDGKKLSEMLLPQQNTFLCRKKDIKKVRELIADDEVREKLSLLRYALVTSSEVEGEGEYYTVYVLRTGSDDRGLMKSKSIIKKSYAKFEQGKHHIFMEMTTGATKEWATVTGNHIGQQIAIVMKGYAMDEGRYDIVISAPSVNQRIDSSTSSIKGNYTEEESTRLASLLDSGSKPAPSTVTSATITLPSIGKKAQTRAFMIFLLVLLLIMLFMMFYYGKGGAVASIGLLFNMLFILGTMAQLDASLSLAGIAGILLTFGMSVDANVLIFETIRQQMLSGVYIARAVTSGYTRAMSSIIDGNLTTLLTGIILYVMGQGPIKGFATTLIIGIVSSLFTSVMVTRLLIELIGAERMNFGFSFTKNLFKNININFYGLRKMAYLLSFSVILTGMGCIVYNGGLSKQLGVEFTGGREVVAKFDTTVSPEAIKTGLSADLDNASVEAKMYGNSSTIKITTSYRIDEKGEKVSEETKQRIVKSLSKLTGKTFMKEQKVLKKDQFTIESSRTVSASIADYVMKMAIYAILLALLMIFGYILLRFRRWQLGLSAIIALGHDVLMIFAGIGIARTFGFVYEIDLIFVGSVLTVIGYSINDTVVVFDFFRNSVKVMSKTDFKDIANKSINGTLSRTLITTFTTFISVFILFLFGGEVLRGFSFTLLIGIIMGTFSSIFALVLSHDLERIVHKLLSIIGYKRK